MGTFLQRVKAIRRPGGRVRVLFLVLGALAFVALTAISVGNLPSDVATQTNIALLFTTAIVGPSATILLNGAEFRSQGRLIGQSHSWTEGIEISVYGTLANLLPLPGALIVRSTALSRAGASAVDVAQVSALAPIQWLASGFLVAGLGGLAVGQTSFGLLSLALCLSSLLIALLLYRKITSGAREFVHLLGIELSLTLLSSARFYLLLRSLGFHVDTGQALATSIAGILANAAGIIPAGLGLREGLISLVAGVVELPVSASFLAAAVDRVAGLVVLGLAMLALQVNQGRFRFRRPGLVDE